MPDPLRPIPPGRNGSFIARWLFGGYSFQGAPSSKSGMTHTRPIPIPTRSDTHGRRIQKVFQEVRNAPVDARRSDPRNPPQLAPHHRPMDSRRSHQQAAALDLSGHRINHLALSCRHDYRLPRLNKLLTDWSEAIKWPSDLQGPQAKNIKQSDRSPCPNHRGATALSSGGSDHPPRIGR